MLTDCKVIAASAKKLGSDRPQPTRPTKRCWLVGPSLKDAGKKAFHTMEIVDAKAEVLAALEAKCGAASAYP